MADVTETVTLAAGGEIDNFGVGIGETWLEDPGPDGAKLVVTAIDRKSGTFTVERMYERLSKDVGDLLYGNRPFFGVYRDTEPTRLAGCSFVRLPTPTSAAVVAVITTVAALEWLRHRKAAVAAAEGSEEAYRSLLSEFLIWLRRWLDRLGRVTV